MRSAFAARRSTRLIRCEANAITRLMQILLPDTGQHGLRAHGQLVAAVQLRRDVGPVLGRPIALAMEPAARARPRESTFLLGHDDGTLDVRAPVRLHDLAVRLLERGMRILVARPRRIREISAARLAPPVEMRVHELRERGDVRGRRARRRAHGRRQLPRHRGERLCRFGHRDLPSISRSTTLTVRREMRFIKGPACSQARAAPRRPPA